MISKAMQDAINEQIKNEFYSAYMYLSMSAYFQANNLPGFAAWLRIQFQEEQTHALKLYDHMIDRGGRIDLKALSQPPAEWKTSLEAFQNVLTHEQHVTALINQVYETALSEKDYPAQVMLQWFINEQVEEEKNATEIVEQLKLVDTHGTAVLMLDHRLGKRGGE
jgi:ferritin